MPTRASEAVPPTAAMSEPAPARRGQRQLVGVARLPAEQAAAVPPALARAEGRAPVARTEALPDQEAEALAASVQAAEVQAAEVQVAVVQAAEVQAAVAPVQAAEVQVAEAAREAQAQLAFPAAPWLPRLLVTAAR